MNKILTVVMLAVSLSSCAPVISKEDYSLNSNGYAVRLSIVNENGQAVAPFEGRYVALPGFVFSRGEIRMHPGRQRIAYICPLKPGDPEILDLAPSVVYDFEAGRRYEAACVDGAPRIRRLGDTAA